MKIVDENRWDTNQITKQPNNEHLSESQNIFLSIFYLSLPHTHSITVERFRLSVGRSTLIINSKCVNLNLDEDVIISISIFSILILYFILILIFV